MPDLFQLPKVIPLNAGAVMAGAKLTFHQTGTSTLQNTYTDAALSVAHANPVVADANGVFAPIFLDPNLPNYRVTLTTSADVTMSGYPVDDVPALSTGGTGLLSYRVATDTGSANALAVTLSNPTPTAYTNGMALLVKVLNNTSSTAPTINVNSLGSRTITHPDGSALVAGELRANETIFIAYNSSASRFDLLSSAYAPGISYAGAAVLVGTATGGTVTGELAFTLSNSNRIPVTKIKTSTTTHTTDIIPGPDAELTYAIPSAGTYRIEAYVQFWGTTTGTQGINCNINYSTTVGNGSGLVVTGYINGAAVGPVRVPVSSTTDAIATTASDISTSAYADCLHWVGTLVAGAAGTIAFASSQQASEANATNIAIGSYLTVTKVG